MIFTFQEHNSIKKYMFFAENKEQAFKELYLRLGHEESKHWSLIAYTPVEKFSIFI